MARRKKHDDHDSHDRWLVSYADFITLLFAFFVVMYGISQVSEGKYKVLSHSLVKAFVRADQQPTAMTPLTTESPAGTEGIFAGNAGNPTPWQANPQILAKMQVIRDNLKQVLEPLEKQGQVRVSETKRGIELEFNAATLFSSGEAALQQSARKPLSQVAQMLSTTDNAIEVQGHTDNIPIATPVFPSNWELSGSRAGSVVRMLIELGVRPERLTAVGYADTRPLVPNATPEGRARNRRVTITVLPRDAEHGERGF
jgi:chemotaxis protein MotB